MSTRAQVIEQLAVVLDMNPMTLELILRYLAKRRLVPQGRRGHRSEHYTAEHLKNVLLAVSAFQPIDAADAVETLDDLRTGWLELALPLPPGAYPDEPDPDLYDIEPGTAFGDWMVQRITAWLSPTPEMLESVDKDYYKGFAIRISMSPLAQLAYVETLGVGRRRKEQFAPAIHLIKLPPHTRRILEITEHVLAVAALLLTDSLAKLSVTPQVLARATPCKCVLEQPNAVGAVIKERSLIRPADRTVVEGSVQQNDSSAGAARQRAIVSTGQ